MSKENQDLVDLCELNLIEERIQEVGTKEEQAELQKAIDWTKRQVMSRIRNNLPPVDPTAEEIYRERNFNEDLARTRG